MLITIHDLSRDTATQAIELAAVFAVFEREYTLAAIADADGICDKLERHRESLAELAAISGAPLTLVCQQAPSSEQLSRLRDNCPLPLFTINPVEFRALLRKQAQQVSF